MIERRRLELVVDKEIRKDKELGLCNPGEVLKLSRLMAGLDINVEYTHRVIKTFNVLYHYLRDNIKTSEINKTDVYIEKLANLSDDEIFGEIPRLGPTGIPIVLEARSKAWFYMTGQTYEDHMLYGDKRHELEPAR